MHVFVSCRDFSELDSELETKQMKRSLTDKLLSLNEKINASLIGISWRSKQKQKNMINEDIKIEISVFANEPSNIHRAEV